MANNALLEWPDNPDISDTPPREYMPIVRQCFADDAERDAMRDAYALPRGWERMDCQDFLAERRHLMAGVIRRGYDRLS